MIKTNLEKLVEVAVCGEVSHPAPAEGGVAWDGAPVETGTFSGIAFNVKVGDPAFDWAGGDHVEPGVGLRNPDPAAHRGLLRFSCIGSEAVIVEARLEGKDVRLKGIPGMVTGKSGGRVLVHFPRRILDRLCVGDRIQIRASGVGLALLDYPDVRLANMAPRLLRALNPSEKSGRVRIPVAKVVPGKLMGGGVGSPDILDRDYDIQSSSPEAVRECSLDQIRLGDLVAISDHDATHGPRWQPGAVTVGVVVHGSSRRSGHGPGINILMTSPKGTIEPIITRKANLWELMGLQ